MKLKDIIRTVDTTETGKEHIIDVESLLECFGYDSYHFDWNRFEGDNALTAHYVKVKMDTDTWVGDAVYHFLGNPVAVSGRSGRKMGESLFFTSKEAAMVVKKYLFSLLSEPEYHFSVLTEGELEEEGPDFFNISWSSEIIVQTGTWEGFRFNSAKETDSSSYLNQEVMISLVHNNSQAVVNVRELKFDLLLKGE